MDPTSLSPEELAEAVAFGSMLLERGPSGIFWLTVLGTVWAWWKSVSKHLCEAIPQALSIMDKFANNGIEVRLKLYQQSMDDCDEKKEA